MKMLRRGKKFMAGLAAFLLLTGSLAGCAGKESRETGTAEEKQMITNEQTKEVQGSTQDTTADSAEITYPLEGNVTLKVAMMGATMGGDYPEFLEEYEKATGVKLEIESLSFDAMNLMFASGELPDLVVTYSNVFANGVNTAIEEDLIVPVNDYLADWAPDLKAYLDGNDVARKSASLENYGVIGAPFVYGTVTQRFSAGLMMRADWLEELNLEVPETADEYYEALKAFKEKKGAQAPLSVTLYWTKCLMTNGLVTSPFGLVSSDLYVKDGKVHYGAAEPEYKDVLAYMHKLYAEDLLDPNFQTVDNETMNANFMNGVSGATANSAGGGIGTYLSTMEKTDTKWDVAGVGSLVAQKGDKALFGRCQNPCIGVYMYMTPACENIEAAVKLMNYGYTQEGHDLFNFGTEGTSYTVENGKHVYSDLIMKNQDGLTMAEALRHYTGALSSFPYVCDDEYWLQYSGRPQQQEALKRWCNNDAVEYVLPPVEVLAEETDENATLASDIDTYVSEMLVKYITGEVSLDTFDTEYLPTLEKMGVKRYLEIQQHALDAFNAR